VYFHLSQKKLDGVLSFIEIETNQQGTHLYDKYFGLEHLDLGCSVSLSRKAKKLSVNPGADPNKDRGYLDIQL